MKEYKTLIVKDRWFGEGITIEKIQEMLTKEAKNGWELVSITNLAKPSSFRIFRDTLLLVFKKDK
jgi:hypothetical protein